MVMYCMGNIGAKRRAFRAVNQSNELCLDNDDVVADFLLNGKVYFVIGAMPFGDMSVWDYICYSRALKTRLSLNASAVKQLLKAAGCKVSLFKKLKNLDRITYRRVMFAAKIDSNITDIYANFDGVAYSLSAKRKLKKLVADWKKSYNVFVSVSDSRFIPKKAETSVYLPDGIVSGYVPQRGKHIRQGKFSRALSKNGMVFKWNNIKDIVLCDN